MLTRLGLVVAGAALALALLAATQESWALALMAVPLLAALALGALVELRAPPRLRVEHGLPAGRFLAGDAVAATFTLVNEGGATGLCEAVVPLPHATFAAAGRPSVVGRVPQGGRWAARYELALPLRGAFALEGLEVRQRGAFGLFTRSQQVPGNAEFQVLPRAEELDALAPLSRRRRQYLGPILQGRPGGGAEFYALRSYLPGDPIDAVNWKQTAKWGKPIVNEFEPEQVADLLLLADARALSNVGAGRETAAEACLRAALSLGRRALKDRYRVGLLVATTQFSVLEPALGTFQEARLLHHIVATVPEGHATLLDLLAPLATQHLPKGALAVLLSPCVSDATVPAFVERLTHLGLRVVVVSPDPGPRPVPAEDFGWRLATLERRARLQELRRAGAEAVVDWDPRDPLAVPLAGVGPRRA